MQEYLRDGINLQTDVRKLTCLKVYFASGKRMGKT